MGPEQRRFRADTLLGEEPLEIQLNGAAYTVTMRTPGDDVDLALGLLHSEAVISTAEDTVTAKHCTDSDLNVLDVTLRVTAPPPRTGFTVSSACGACGTSSLDALWEYLTPRLRYEIASDPVSVEVPVLTGVPEKLRAAQRTFSRTGGSHGAALFTSDGDLLCVREDVGRHNAVDKVIGWALREGRLPLNGNLLAVSGRVGAEIVQKAAMAGIPVLAAISAPSTLAVDLAQRWGMTLAGFVRDGRCNVYSGFDRIADDVTT
ncbi:FdhD protein [Stackebrandtia endophytica]|uniref:Sulfur carrier protein FdhD n=1 Tax=Stackebrandtia endophytica TaxID=1496996 RepID=A0A543AWT5_9ACTN|nr:FdhD protein [Stackebrandtia endophytica]